MSVDDANSPVAMGTGLIGSTTTDLLLQKSFRSWIAKLNNLVFHGFMVHAMGRRLSGCRRPPGNQRTGLMFIASSGLAFCAFHALSALCAIGIRTLAMPTRGVHSIRLSLVPVPPGQMPRPLQRLPVRARA